MADPISIASGLVALATFAFESSKNLYQVVQSFKGNQRAIRELKEELEALDGVLQSLQQAAGDSDADLQGLELPLLRCGKACADFQAMIVNCTAHSGGSRTSFRDWAKLKYMGEDIAGFRNMLAGYKSTIGIALGGANLRTAAVTIDVLNQYKEMITNTTSDLEEHLQAIDEKLQSLSSQDARVSGEDAAEREHIQQEMESTRQCLRICAQVSEHMDQVRPSALDALHKGPNTHPVIIAKLEGYVSAKGATSKALKECKETLTNTTAELEEYLQKLNNRLEDFLRGDSTSGVGTAEHARVQEEKKGVEHCLKLCERASHQADDVQTNVFEDVSVAHDSHQVVVATLGDLISARRVSAGARSKQWLGQMSDASVQQLSKDCTKATLENIVEPQSGMTENFEDRYGTGKQLHKARGSR